MCSRREERHKKRHNLSAAAENIDQSNNKIGEPGFFREMVLPEKPAMDEKHWKRCDL